MLAHLHSKTIDFFTTEPRVHRNICSFICSWAIIYIHVIAYASQTKEWISVVLYAMEKPPPPLKSRRQPVLFTVYTRLKRKIKYTAHDVCWMIFTKQQHFSVETMPSNKLLRWRSRMEKWKLVLLIRNAMWPNEKMARDSTFDGCKCLMPDKMVAINDFLCESTAQQLFMQMQTKITIEK